MKRDFNTNSDPLYKYMLFYFDDLIYKGFKPNLYMDELHFFLLKEIFPHELYLGSNVEKIQLEDGYIFWYTNCVE